MEKKIKLNVEVFEANYKIARSAFFLNSGLEASACASAFIGDPQPTTEAAMKEAKAILKRNTKFFSTLKGNAMQVVVATLAQSSDPEDTLEKIKMIHKGLDKKFFDSDYLVLAAVMIYKSARESEYDYYIKRTREIYKLLRHDHPFITNSEDITNCVIMALSDVDVNKLAEVTEEAFAALKKKFLSSNKVQYMACIAGVFNGSASEKADIIRNTYDMLKAEGVRFDTEAFAIVAAIGMLVREEDKKAVIKRIDKLSGELKNLHGLGPLGAGKRIRNTLASAIVLEAYTGGDTKARSAVINAIIATIIAIEVACCATASSAAASSASYASSST